MYIFDTFGEIVRRYKMNKMIKEDLLDWAKTEKSKTFENFIIFLSYAQENKKQMEVSYYDETEYGCIDRISFIYNRRFMDFDFQIKLKDRDYLWGLECIYMYSINQISTQEYHITDRNDNIFKIKIAL